MLAELGDLGGAIGAALLVSDASDAPGAGPSRASGTDTIPLVQLGMVGLGRMGANIVRRLVRDGHECVAYDVAPDAIARAVDDGATGADSLDDFVAKLQPHGPRG